jgi:hypothetical protein
MKKLFTFLLCMCLTVSAFSQVVIYEIYGGGGNTGGIYKNDYIILLNKTASPVSVAGWSVQYVTAASTTQTWAATNLSGTIPSNSCYLIQLFAGTAGDGLSLPTPNAVGTTNLSATAGKIVLKDNTIVEATANPTGVNIIDKVGYGSAATGSETSPVVPSPNINNTQSITRINNGQDTDNNLNDFAVTAPKPDFCKGVLPVELTYFQTQATDNQKVNIKWETAMEINSNYFILERSRDAVNYKTIANIEAAGSSTSKKTYSFTDESALFGTNYYRLSQIDKDGTQQVFRPQAVIIDDANVPFGVFPNPSIGLNFSVKVEDSDEANLNLTDFSGRVIGLNINKLTQTILEVTPLESLKFGMYILEVQTLGSLKKHKILILK